MNFEGQMCEIISCEFSSGVSIRRNKDSQSALRALPPVLVPSSDAYGSYTFYKSFFVSYAFHCFLPSRLV